jgi:hypothetical protein
MSTPVPFRGSSPPAPRPDSGAYTHRTWLDEMADVLGHVAGIFKDMGVMHHTLHEVEAGQTQMRLVGDAEAVALTLMTSGVGFVDATDRRYMPVFDAIQQAGGQDEVAKDKRYHDRT